MLICHVSNLFFVDCSSDFEFNHRGFFYVSNYTDLQMSDDETCACNCNADTTCLAYHFNNVSSGCFLYKALGDISIDYHCSAYIKKSLECSDDVECML